MPARDRPAPDDGFTLVELLVVIVIVAVLSAIAVPVYVQQRRHAHDATARAELRQLVPSVIDAMSDFEAPTGFGTTVSYNLSIVRRDGRYLLRGTGIDGELDLGAATSGIAILGVSSDLDVGLVSTPAESPLQDWPRSWCLAMSHPDGTGSYYRYTPDGGFQTVTASTACVTQAVGGGPPPS